MTFSERYLTHLRACWKIKVGMTSHQTGHVRGREIIPLQFLKGAPSGSASLGARATKGKTNIGLHVSHGTTKNGNPVHYYV
jgi:saccharopine dehydrogenase-like NADP-dependent oxidoreductase